EDEIVFLLQGKAILQFKNNNEYITKKTLTGGQSLKISKNILHRVEYTSENPMCIWLCVFQKD
ncbi:MAG: cupin, partial [Oscillospiraceae bacterium]